MAVINIEGLKKLQQYVIDNNARIEQNKKEKVEKMVNDTDKCFDLIEPLFGKLADVFDTWKWINKNGLGDKFGNFCEFFHTDDTLEFEIWVRDGLSLCTNLTFTIKVWCVEVWYGEYSYDWQKLIDVTHYSTFLDDVVTQLWSKEDYFDIQTKYLISGFNQMIKELNKFLEDFYTKIESLD